MATAPRNEIAVAGEHDGKGVPRPSDRSGPQQLTLEEVYYLAQQVAAGKLFPGFDTVPQTFTLMMLCQSEGLHPMQALKRYDVIEGRPALKAAAIQAEFIARGGSIRLLRLDDEEARAVFGHSNPRLMYEPVERAVTFAQFENTYARGRDGQIKKNWKHSRPDMLWARLMTFCRKVDPGIATGIPLAEDISDSETTAPPVGFTPPHVEPAGKDRVVHETYQHFATAAAADFLVALKKEGLDTGGFKPAAIHAHLVNAAVEQGLMEKPRDRKTSTVLLALSGLYQTQRDWIEVTTWEYLDYIIEEAKEARGGESATEDAVDYDAAGLEVSGREPGEDG